eukprot:1177039-Prorocentrum_minimum.AAC.3
MDLKSSEKFPFPNPPHPGVCTSRALSSALGFRHPTRCQKKRGRIEFVSGGMAYLGLLAGMPLPAR